MQKQRTIRVIINHFLQAYLNPPRSTCTAVMIHFSWSSCSTEKRKNIILNWFSFIYLFYIVNLILRFSRVKEFLGNSMIELLKLYPFIWNDWIKFKNIINILKKMFDYYIYMKKIIIVLVSIQIIKIPNLDT